MLQRFFILVLIAWVVPAANARTAEKVTYEAHVKPILREHCFACHNQDDANADLALDSFEGTLNGGAGGEVLVAGEPDSSRLWKLVTHQEAPKMPPGDRLPQAELEVLRKWIAGGLLNDVNSKPLKSKKPAIATIDSSKLGKPVGAPAMPTQLYHEPVVWTATPGPVEALATSPWAPLVAVGWQRQVSFYHTDSHELLGIVPYVDGVPKVVRFSRDGSLVLIAGGRHAAAGSASLFDVKTGSRLATLGDELDIVLAADISPDLSLVAIGGPKKRVRVYRVADGQLAYQIAKHTDWITTIGFSPDGKFLATADRNGGAFIWQAKAGHERADLRGHQEAITALDWRADSAMLATASEDGTARLWNPKGKQIKSITAHKPGVQSVRFANNGNWVTAGRDRHVRTWKPGGAALADLGKMPGIALSAAYTHDGQHVIATDYSGEVRVIDPKTKKPIAKLPANPPHLSQKLANTEEALQKAKRRLNKSKKLAKSTLAKMELGKADHQTHQTKLAKAEALVSERRKLYEVAVQLLEQHQQNLADTAKSMNDATATLAKTRTRLEQAVAESETVPAEEENSSEANETQADAIVAFKQQVEVAAQQYQTAKQIHDAAQQTTNASTTKQLAAQKEIEAAEALVAQVSNETAGLPDLQKLTESHAQADAGLATALQRHQQAEQTKAKLTTQQQLFTAATTRRSKILVKQQAEQQELAKQSGRLETKHQQAATSLATHSTQLREVAHQLQAIQTKLSKLKEVEVKLKANESTLAQQLSEVQAALNQSLQQSELLDQSRRDFDAAQQLRKKYSTAE